MERKLSYNKDNLDCYSKSYDEDINPEFIRAFNEGKLVIPYKFTNLFVDCFLKIDDRVRHVYIVKDKYFIPDKKTKHLPFDDYKGTQDAINIISMLLVTRTYNFLHKKNILPKFIPIFFKNIKDILYFTNLLKIKEISQFIENLFKLHKVTDVKKTPILEFINNLGGESYIKDMIASYVYFKSRSLRNNKDEKDKHNKIEIEVAEILNTVTENMKTDKVKENFLDYVIYIGKSSFLRAGLTFLSFTSIKKVILRIEEMISDKYIMEYYNREEINDINYLIEGKPIYSKFLSAYSDVEKHYYKFQYTEFIKNPFYNEFVSLCGSFDDKTNKLLMINLAILMQNN